MAKIRALRQILEIKITLQGVKPPIWRRLRVRSDITLSELHDIIQIAMGWNNTHLHEFVIDGEHYGPAGIDEDFDDEMGDETTVRLDLIASSKFKFKYTYDFGDDWEHTVLVEKISPFKPEMETPQCLAGKNACPPEDCGGPWGYAEMLEKLADPASSERSELLEYFGNVDPEQFNIQAVNEKLQRLAA